MEAEKRESLFRCLNKINKGMGKMSCKLIITTKENRILSSFFEGDHLVQIHVEKKEESLLGNLYLAKVKNIVKNINAAFVEIEDGRMCYISLEECQNPVFGNVKKNNKINAGDTVVVQVVKEDVKTKAPYATANFGFTGKYVVLTHGKTRMGISSKITDNKERERIKAVLKPYENQSFGLVARTNSAGVGEEKINNEIRLLQGRYENILNFGIHKGQRSCIYRAPQGYLCNIRDGYASQLKEIITDEPAIFEEIKEYINSCQPEDIGKLRLYEDASISLSSLYGIETKIARALQKQVWLKSGGTLVIEPTEALTVIDVNTGKAIKGNKKIQETFFKVNKEAAAEIARQIRLRNLSGIIVVDFIDLKEERAREELLSLLAAELKKDPVKTVAVDMTPLGLVEITRKKVRKPLHEQMKGISL